MKRIATQGFIVILAFILQNTVFVTLSFNGVRPNLLLIITVFFGFADSANNGMLTGFFGGLLCDIFFGSYIGVYSFLFMILGCLGGVMAKIFYQDDIIFPYVTIALSDGLFGLMCYVFMFLLRGRFVFSDYLYGVIIPELLYTILLSFLLFPLLRRFKHFFDMLAMKEKESDAS